MRLHPGTAPVALFVAFLALLADCRSHRSSELSNLVYTDLLGVPTNVLFLLALYFVAWAYLTFTKGGRTIYAVGSNVEAARASGLNVLFYSILPYVISGALAAVAITFSIAQILSADPLAGNQMELDAIAAVVIGGTSLSGGRGTIVGTLIGALIMSVLANGLRILSVAQEWQTVVTGSIIILAVYTDILRRLRL